MIRYAINYLNMISEARMVLLDNEKMKLHDMKRKRHAPHVPSYQPQHAPPPRAFYTAPVSQTNVNVARNSFTNQPKTQAPQASGFSESQTTFQVSPDQPTHINGNGNGNRKKIVESSDSFYSEGSYEFEEVAATCGQHSRRPVCNKQKVSYEENVCDDGKKEENNVFAKTFPNRETRRIRKTMIKCEALITVQEPDCITIPNFEFHDFSGKRSEGKFTVGQIWSLNCKEEGLPKYYTKIQEVEWKPMFKLQINKLKLKSLPENTTQ
ncbi:hypothetical protein Bca52824_038912 [Brassica carinata]|uniref:DUF3444 domain-containing protein n=1 Tax=Brassica carinata TaxID=52824 RepID=A0A8X7RQK1_BRACI|nr:hypothetical protein Bca52824_038912 [Brassica carinata]